MLDEKTEHFNLTRKFVCLWECNFSSASVFRRQPAEFFFSKKFVKWKHAKPILLYRLIPMASVRLEFWPSLTSWTKALMLKKFLRISCYLCEGAMLVWLIGLKKISKAERISSWPLNLSASFSSVIPVIGTWSGSSHVFTISEPTIFSTKFSLLGRAHVVQFHGFTCSQHT